MARGVISWSRTDLLGANWHIPELLAGGGVHTMMDVVAATRLAINGVVEGLKVEGGDFGGRHFRV